MINEVQAGKIMEYENSGSAISSGDVVIIGERVGIALADIDATTGTGSVALDGVFLVDKATGTAWSQGDKLFYNSAGPNFTKTATSGYVYAGIAFEAAASGDATGYIKLDQASPKKAANVAFSAGSNLVGVDGTGSNAAPLTGTETRLDSLDTAVAAILTALKNAGIMADS